MVGATDHQGRILAFVDRSRYYFFQVAPHLFPRGSVDAENVTRDLCACS
jgi:hypothetical protein